MNDTESGLILRINENVPGYFVSLNGQVKFYTLASMLLESAGRHAEMHGFGYQGMIREKVYWVLSRFQVRMLKYPSMNDPVIIETWPKGPDRLFFIRDYRISTPEGTTLALATTAWLVLDGNTGRPQRLDDSHRLHDFHVDDFHAIVEVPGKLPGVEEPDRSFLHTARYSDLDINKHVNSLKYIEWIQDCYDQEDYLTGNFKEFQINYHMETRFGEEVDIRMKNASGDDSFDYFEGIRTADQNLAFRACVGFGKIQLNSTNT